MAEERIDQDFPVQSKNEAVIHLKWTNKSSGTKGIDRYIARYTAALHEHRWQTGEAASWSLDHVHPVDDRTCHQDLRGRYERKVYFDNERRSESNLESKYSTSTPVVISAQGTGPGIGNFFRSTNCNDAEGEFNGNRSNALKRMEDGFNDFVTHDRQVLVAELIRDYKTDFKVEIG
jgi:hypothetical protein